jgi:hypothetical protein
MYLTWDELIVEVGKRMDYFKIIDEQVILTEEEDQNIKKIVLRIRNET